METIYTIEIGSDVIPVNARRLQSQVDNQGVTQGVTLQGLHRHPAPKTTEAACSQNVSASDCATKG